MCRSSLATVHFASLNAPTTDQIRRRHSDTRRADGAQVSPGEPASAGREVLTVLFGLWRNICAALPAESALIGTEGGALDETTFRIAKRPRTPPEAFDQRSIHGLISGYWQ